MSTLTKYKLDRRRLRQARKAIPDVTWRLPLGYCQNPGELVLSEGRNYKLLFFLLEANPILPMTPRDGCGAVYYTVKCISLHSALANGQRLDMDRPRTDNPQV